MFMSKHARKSCPRCQQLQRQLEGQAAQIKSLRAAVQRLEEKLAAAQKDSSTSSKPPSSDLVKPPPAASVDGSERRSIGGQLGHAKHEREPFPPEQVTHFAEHVLDACPCCGGRLRRNGHLARVVQQIDIVQPPLTIAQHTCPDYWCQHCQRSFKAPM